MYKNKYWIKIVRFFYPKHDVNSDITKDVNSIVSYLTDTYPTSRVPMILKQIIDEFEERAINSAELKEKELSEAITLIESINNNLKTNTDEKVTYCIDAAQL